MCNGSGQFVVLPKRVLEAWERGEVTDINILILRSEEDSLRLLTDPNLADYEPVRVEVLEFIRSGAQALQARIGTNSALAAAS